MRTLLLGLALSSLLMCNCARASTWSMEGSVLELKSRGDARIFTYLAPRAGISAGRNAVFFRGAVSGGSYSGTAYVFPRGCPSTAYEVSGGVDVARRQIVLYGKAPIVNEACEMAGFADDVISLRFNACGNEGDCGDPAPARFGKSGGCGREPELVALYSSPPPRSEPPKFRIAEAAPVVARSCPYLYAWNANRYSWTPYGKVIQDARGHEISEAVKLLSFATKFRLAEQEPEESFISKLELQLTTKAHGIVRLTPHWSSLEQEALSVIHIKAFKSTEFEFRLPPDFDATEVTATALLISGRYDRLPAAPPPEAQYSERKLTNLVAR